MKSVDPSHRIAFQVPVDSPELWHGEHPFLYELKVETFAGGKLLQTVSDRFGFRKIEVRGNEVFVNGRPVKLRGICRHIVHPLYGRAIPRELIVEDVRLFREVNCNLIRTSHYPPEEELLDLCDENGIFVMNEAPFCWSSGDVSTPGFVSAINENNAGYAFRVTQELVRRDRNHPSVLIWSQANESRWGVVL